MPNVVKERILEEIRRLAEAGDGKPPGMIRFRSATGINETEWLGIYWARWSDALIEAGYSPNQWNSAADKDHMLESYAKLANELGRLPVKAELKLKRRNDKEFPSEAVFGRRFGGKRELVRAVAEYCEGKPEFAEISIWAHEYVTRSVVNGSECSANASGDVKVGYVYLAKSGRHYKIGRTNNTGRREYEIGLQLPEKLRLIHVIETDDPVGIEAYWHNRFDSRRKNGEWFELTKDDITAFKRRRKFM